MISKKTQSEKTKTSEWFMTEDNQGQTRYENLFNVVPAILARKTRIDIQEAENAFQDFVEKTVRKDYFAHYIEEGKEISTSTIVDFARGYLMYGWQHRGTQLHDRAVYGCRSYVELEAQKKGETLTPIKKGLTEEVLEHKPSGSSDLQAFDLPFQTEYLQRRVNLIFTRHFKDRAPTYFKVFMEEAHNPDELQQNKADRIGISLRLYREYKSNIDKILNEYGKEFFNLD